MANYCKTCHQEIRKIKLRDFGTPHIKKIMLLMKKHNLSVYEMREMMGVSKITFYRYLRNESKPKKIHWELLKLKGIN
jgi:hypothetical protein